MKVRGLEISVDGKYLAYGLLTISAVVFLVKFLGGFPEFFLAVAVVYYFLGCFKVRGVNVWDKFGQLAGWLNRMLEEQQRGYEGGCCSRWPTQRIENIERLLKDKKEVKHVE